MNLKVKYIIYVHNLSSEKKGRFKSRLTFFVRVYLPAGFARVVWDRSQLGRRFWHWQGRKRRVGKWDREWASCVLPASSPAAVSHHNLPSPSRTATTVSCPDATGRRATSLVTPHRQRLRRVWKNLIICTEMVITKGCHTKCYEVFTSQEDCRTSWRIVRNDALPHDSCWTLSLQSYFSFSSA